MKDAGNCIYIYYHRTKLGDRTILSRTKIIISMFYMVIYVDSIKFETVSVGSPHWNSVALFAEPW